ncbi:mCG1036297, partial [Mus musculus]
VFTNQGHANVTARVQRTWRRELLVSQRSLSCSLHKLFSGKKERGAAEGRLACGSCFISTRTTGKGSKDEWKGGG